MRAKTSISNIIYFVAVLAIGPNLAAEAQNATVQKIDIYGIRQKLTPDSDKSKKIQFDKFGKTQDEEKVFKLEKKSSPFGAGKLLEMGGSHGGGGDPRANEFVDDAEMICHWALKTQLNAFPELKNCEDQIEKLRASLNNPVLPLVQFTFEDLIWMGAPKAAVFNEDSVLVNIPEWESMLLDQQFETEAIELAGMAGSQHRYNFGSVVRKAGLAAVTGRVPRIRIYDEKYLAPEDLSQLSLDELKQLRNQLRQQIPLDEERKDQIFMELMRSLEQVKTLYKNQGGSSTSLEDLNSPEEINLFLRRSHITADASTDIGRALAKAYKLDRAHSAAVRVVFARGISLQNVESLLK